MRILMINKFLHPNGGSETYIFKLGQALKARGHGVEYFGMEHAGRIVGNRVQAYTANMDFHGGSKIAKLLYPIKTIYSAEARKKIRQVLEDFRPDVCHLNNFNYQLTPSIILEIRKWERQSRQKVRIVFTAHDYQLVCPNHMCRRGDTGENCRQCLDGSFLPCLKGRCIHGSLAKSAVGMAEAMFWKAAKVYRHLDTIICCSEFMKQKMDTNPLFAAKTVMLHNFIDAQPCPSQGKEDYVLYFGRYTREKGVSTLLEAARALPHIPFVFAGSGPLEQALQGIANIRNVGFRTGEDLKTLIARARLSVCPSEWYENCPFSVMESQMYGTPVLGADIGGIPELMRPGETGELFESGNVRDLQSKLQALWADPQKLTRYSQACLQCEFDTVDSYCEKLMPIYTGAR